MEEETIQNHEDALLSMGQREEVAIKLSSASKHYGSMKKNTPVLIGLDMEVLQGQIYGLLGPSGCGKTTLLKCIVGKLKLDSGLVQVFGQSPGSPGCGVPGKRVGYMPQELALFGEFNISETLRYFARIFGLSESKFQERLNFLMKFLDLPSKTRMLQNMSGGQQRRASLAVALLHEPDLLILDEPTVGVDPLLRSSIWNHMTDLSKETKTTIVITTHYIEEARKADRVGMMRFGKLLAEGTPESLLQSFEQPNLESVFLELCLQDGDLETTRVREERLQRPPILKRFSPSKKKGKEDKTLTDKTLVTVVSEKNSISHPNNSFSNKNGPKALMTTSSKLHSKLLPPSSSIKLSKLNACMIKTFNRMKKRIGFLIYQFVLPAIQVSLFCLAIGRDPRDLSIGVVNRESLFTCISKNETALSECPITPGQFGIPEPNEHLRDFTCRFMSYIDDAVVNPVYFNDYDTALQSVRDGQTWGVIAVDANFTQFLYKRIFDSMTTSDLRTIDTEILDKSSVKIKLDLTNQHIAFTLRMKLLEAFQEFMTQMITSCNMPKELADIPLLFEEPVYGSDDLTFTDFMAPGIILTIVHSMALGYSAMIIIMERNEGLMDRTWIAGVTPGEFALAHFLVSLCINLAQVIVTLIFMILIFKVPAHGSIVWIFLLTMLQGISGTTIGLIISAICETQQDATQIALGIFYPNLILSGIIWPIESMPWLLRYVSYILPQTFACEAMRGILLRGWDLSYMPVWRGYLVTTLWIVITYAIFKKIVNKER